MNKPTLVLLMFLLCAGGACSAELPAAPRSLLAVLPVSNESWRVKSSTASTAYATWFTSEASRTYASVEGEQEIVLTLHDTGSHPSGLERYEKFSPMDLPHLKRGKLNGRPTQIVRIENTTTIEMLVDNRFVLTLSCKGFETPEELDAFLETWLDFSEISSVPRSGRTELPAELPIVSLDELDPNNKEVHMVASKAPSSVSEKERLANQSGHERGAQKEEQRARLMDLLNSATAPPPVVPAPDNQNTDQ